MLAVAVPFSYYGMTEIVWVLSLLLSVVAAGSQPNRQALYCRQCKHRERRGAQIASGELPDSADIPTAFSHPQCATDEPPTRNQAQKTAHSPAPTASGGHSRWTQVDTQCTFVNIASQIHISHVQLDDLFTVRRRLRRAGKDCQCRYVQQL